MVFKKKKKSNKLTRIFGNVKRSRTIFWEREEGRRRTFLHPRYDIPTIKRIEFSCFKWMIIFLRARAGRLLCLEAKQYNTDGL